MQQIDYIVVGGGIAGITLAHHLVERNLRVDLYINSTPNFSSSRVAAGLFNPVTGRQMVKTWKADLLFPYLQQYYKNIGKKTEEDFFFEKTIYRPFFSVEEQNDWLGKSSDPGFEKYIKEVHIKARFPDVIKDPYGGLALNYSGWVDTAKYIDASIRYFNTRTSLVNVFFKNFNTAKVKVKKKVINYEGAEARNLIFSEGVDLQHNPFFNWLPLNPLKGEILDVKLPFMTNEIINRGVFVLPVGGNIFRVGSTYRHNDLSWEPTAEGKEQLSEKLRGLVSTDFEVTGHSAGLRPATKDRRPFVGRHPEHENIIIFNGLGTKGVSLSPYFAGQLVSNLEDKEELEEQANIQRFFSLYCN